MCDHFIMMVTVHCVFISADDYIIYTTVFTGLNAGSTCSSSISDDKQCVDNAQCTSDSNSQYRCQCGDTYYNNNGACANRTYSRGACLQLCICPCSQLRTSAPPGKPGLVRFVTVVGLMSCSWWRVRANSEKLCRYVPVSNMDMCHWHHTCTHVEKLDRIKHTPTSSTLIVLYENRLASVPSRKVDAPVSSFHWQSSWWLVKEIIEVFSAMKTMMTKLTRRYSRESHWTVIQSKNTCVSLNQ